MLSMGLLALASCRDNRDRARSSARPQPGVTPSRAARAPAGAVIERYTKDLELVAKPRPPGSPHWRAVQDRCAAALQAAGLTVRREAYATGVNVVGELPGATRPDELVIMGAHYDSVPDCAGADDNGSGVAGALEAARVLGGVRYARTLIVACWDEEERGLIGSAAHAAAIAQQPPHRRPVVVYDFEMIGYRATEPGSQTLPAGTEVMFPDAYRELHGRQMRGDFIALVHDAGARGAAARIVRHAGAVELPAIALELPEAMKSSPMVRDLFRSDHASFWDRGFPAIMITDTANFRNPRYHCRGGPDEVSTIDAVFATRVVTAVARAAAEDLQPLATSAF